MCQRQTVVSLKSIGVKTSWRHKKPVQKRILEKRRRQNVLNQIRRRKIFDGETSAKKEYSPRKLSERGVV